MDIKKNLIVQAKLQDEALKKQIQKLKKSLGEGVTLQGQDLTAFKKTFQDVAKSFSEEIKKALKQTGTMGGPTGGKTPSVMAVNNQAWSEFDRDRARAFSQQQKLREKEEKQRLQKEIQFEQNKEMLRDRRLKNRQKESMRHESRILELREQRMARIRRNEQLDKTATVRGLTGMGMSPSRARDIRERLGGAGGGMFGRGGFFGRGGAMLGALGTAGMMTGAVIGGSAAISGSFGAVRQGQILRARQAQELGTMGIQGGGAGALESLVRQRGRAGTSKFNQIASGVLGFYKGLPSGSPLEGIRGGFAQAREEQAAVESQKVKPLTNALNYTRSIRGGRLEAMRGGGISPELLNAVQGAGTQQGFAPEESLQQFIQARQFVGNKPSAGGLEQMQSLYNRTGVGIEQQAQTAETFLGGSRGQVETMGGGINRLEKTLKKGVAAGLDASKSGQFLKTTADYVSQTAGLGQVDLEAIENNFRDFTRNFAGGGQATQMDLRRAAQLGQTVKSESVSAQGAAGIGNIVGVQEALGENATTGQFLAALNLSSDATIEDMIAAGLSPEQAKRLKKTKGTNQSKGLETMGISPKSSLGLAIGAEERGQTVEQQLGALKGQFGGIEGPAQVALPEGVRGSEEFRAAIQEAIGRQTQFVEGVGESFNNLKIATGSLAIAVQKAAADIQEAADYVKITGKSE